MKKGILLSVVALALVFGGCAKKAENAKATDSSANKGQAKPLIPPFVSTTAVMPPQNNDPKGYTLVTLGSTNPNPFYLFFYGSMAVSRPRFQLDPSKVDSISTKVGAWLRYQFTSKDASAAQLVRIYVNYDNINDHFYDTIYETPNTATPNIFLGLYTSATYGNATIIVGDATIFAP